MLTIATIDGHIAGMLAIRPPMLDQLFVAPAWQGRGVGRALFAEARHRMPGGFTLWTQPDNIRARRFYERQGMALISIGPRADKPGQVVVHYEWRPV